MHGLMEEKNHPIFPGDRKFSNDIYAYPFFFSVLINRFYSKSALLLQKVSRIWYHTTWPWVEVETPSFSKPNRA